MSGIAGQQSYNPFDSIFQQMNRMESMIVELNQRICQLQDEKKKDETGIQLAMDITGYTAGTIYNLVSKREIPHSKKRGRIAFDREELERWWFADGKRLTAKEARESA